MLDSLSRAMRRIPDWPRALEDEVHVWLVQPETWRSAFCRDSLILSADERAAADAFTLEHLRERYVSAHCALRRMLSLYADTAPDSWVFHIGKRGRPIVTGGAGLDCNLSYGDDLIAIAIARDAELGIDIISTRRQVKAMQIAEHAFAPREIVDLRSMDVDLVRDRFFDYWTLKEAYAKATGAGFWEKPNRYAFSFPRRGAIQFEHEEKGDGSQWQFVLADAPRDHRLAVAVRIAAGRERKIVARMAPGGEIFPLKIDRVTPRAARG